MSPFKLVAALSVLFIFAAVNAVGGAEAPRPKRVLIISTGSRLAPGFILVDQQLLQALGKVSGRIETYAENLDLVRFPSERYQRIFRDYLAAKYAEYPPDLVILVYVGHLSIPGELLPQLFPRTAIIVAGLTEEELRPDQFGTFVSGVAQRVDPRATLELILRLQPERRRVVVIGGTAEVDRHVLNQVREAARLFKGRFEFDFWDNRSMAELRQAVTALPQDTAILFARMFRDAAGQAFISSQVAQSIAQSANVPVYVMADANLGTGAVGGSVASIEAFGKRAGELARLILTGTDIKTLPFEIHTDSIPTFNWPALQRWGIPENRLPPGSVVLRKPMSIWMQYRWYIIGAATVIALQSLMIAGLMLQRARRRRAEAELSESRQFMDLATEAGGIGLWVRDLVQGDLWANPRMRSLLGFDQDDAFKIDDVLARINPDDRAQIMSVIERAQETGKPFEVEFRTAIPGAPERWIAFRGQFVRGPQGQVVRRMGTMIDITERKRAEDKFRLAVEASPNAIVMVDGQGKMLLVNGLTEQLFGYSRAELIGQAVEMLVPERFRVEHPAHRAAFFGAPQARAMGAGRDLFARRKDGSEFLVEILLNPIHTPEGILVLTAVVDITERKRIELELQRNREELAHVARVSTVGELTASVAHELNQPLGAILSNAEAAELFLTAEPPALDEVREILADIRKDDQRASEVIRRMRSLLRKQELAPKAVEINDAVEDVLKLLSIDASTRKVAMKFERAADLPRVWCDPVHLQQVVLNLVLNGMEAMVGLPEEKRRIVVRTGSGDNGAVKIAVADSGPGIPVDRLPKLFEPFFTTKEGGMGMGLSIARTIVEAHHGEIWAENNSGTGATFYFTVPVAKEASA